VEESTSNHTYLATKIPEDPLFELQSRRCNSCLRNEKALRRSRRRASWFFGDFSARCSNLLGELSSGSANGAAPFSPRRHITQYPCGRCDGEANGARLSCFPGFHHAGRGDTDLSHRAKLFLRLPKRMIRFFVPLKSPKNRLLSANSRGDKTAIELFLAGTRALALQTCMIDAVRVALRC